MTTSLKHVISPAFYDVHRAIRAGRADEVILKGGRGSTKSSFASVQVIVQLLAHRECHAVVVRKVKATLRSSVYAQVRWAVSALGMDEQFECSVSPMQMVYKPTGQTVFFYGLDDPGKLKSIKVPFGHIGILWFEELDQYDGPEEIRNVEQSVLRGGHYAFVLKSFNPPRSPRCWVNRYCREKKEGRLVHHSTYLTTPPDWLGERFFAEAEHLKKTNPSAYLHEYMGEAVGGGVSVFDNLRAETIADSQIEGFDRVCRGVDWGYYPDPFAYNECHYDAARRTLYIFGEITALRQGNEKTAQLVAARGRRERITADSAEPKSIGDFKAAGLPCTGARKGPGSVEHGMRWLQSLEAIVIDPERCPDTLAEFEGYEYERDPMGRVIEGYPDRENHHIDAVRYAVEHLSAERAAKTIGR